MKALIVVDMQKIITKQKDFSSVTGNIEKLVKKFRKDKNQVVFVKQVSLEKDDFFFKDYETTSIDFDILEEELVVEKQSPSIFKNTVLDEHLRKRGITELVIVGFNTEFCCLFSTIAAFDRGYQVTFVEDAIGSCNDETTYEMPGLDINDFVGTFLDWSGVVTVVDTEELFE
jgi:nicotinamidase-related amidase